MYSLRLAETKDIPSLILLCVEFQEAHVPEFEIDFDKMKELFTHFIKNQPNTHTVITLVKEDELCGFLAAQVQDHPFMKMKIASEIAWWVTPEHRGKFSFKLLDAYQYWASRVGAHVSQLAVPPLGDYERLGKLYERNGYRLQEQVYLKRLA